MRPAALLLNLVASLLSVGWAAVAVVQPAALAGAVHITDGLKFYVRMYAARTIPFGLATAIIPFCAVGKTVGWLLFTAAVIQFADALIALENKKRAMLIGASVGAVVHFVCGLIVMWPLQAM